MQLDVLFNALLSDPDELLKNVARFFHFIGLALGLGAASTLDLIAVRFFVGNRVTRARLEVFEFGTKIVHAGLILLWISGIAFLLHYITFDPSKLTNQKVWAKLVIVGILSINGMFIHTMVLPFIRRQIGRTLFEDVSTSKRFLFTTAGMISAVSWYAPVAIGALSQLNFKVPMPLLLTTYGLVLTAAVIMGCLVTSAALLLRPPNQPDRAYPGPTGPSLLINGKQKTVKHIPW